MDYSKNKKNLFIWIVVGTIVLVGVWLLFFKEIEQSNFNNQLVAGKETEIPQEEIKEGVVLIINSGKEDVKTFEANFDLGMTAFDLLKNKTEELGLLLEAKTFDIGVLIETIGNKKNGDENKYWLYYINDEMPMVAADKKEIKSGDKVEFKFEKSKF